MERDWVILTVKFCFFTDAVAVHTLSIMHRISVIVHEVMCNILILMIQNINRSSPLSKKRKLQISSSEIYGTTNL